MATQVKPAYDTGECCSTDGRLPISTPRPRGSIAGASGILDHPLSRCRRLIRVLPSTARDPADPEEPTAANSSSPSGTDRSRARTAGPRGSPTPPATGRGACRRRRTRWGARSDSRSVLARTLPRGSRSTPSVFNRPSCTGCTKPIASSTSCASSSNSLPAIGLNLSSTCTQCSFATLPSTARELLRQHRVFAPRAFGLARRGAHLQRPVRPGQALVLVLGRRRHDFELRHRQRALPERGADAVRSGVAAADHHHMLAAGENVRRRRRAARCRRGGFAAAGNPSRSECRRDRGRGSAGRARLPRRRSAPARHIR